MRATALCGRQSCLQAAFQAAVEQTTHSVARYFSGFVLAGIPQRSLRNSSRIGNGGRRLLAGFVEILRNFSGFAAQHLRDTKPQKFVAYQEGGLKPAAG
jgi:hypothetical protein